MVNCECEAMTCMMHHQLTHLHIDLLTVQTSRNVSPKITKIKKFHITLCLTLSSFIFFIKMAMLRVLFIFLQVTLCLTLSCLDIDLTLDFEFESL